jgi:hypothetical protein
MALPLTSATSLESFEGVHAVVALLDEDEQGALLPGLDSTQTARCRATLRELIALSAAEWTRVHALAKQVGVAGAFCVPVCLLTRCGGAGPRRHWEHAAIPSRVALTGGTSCGSRGVRCMTWRARVRPRSMCAPSPRRFCRPSASPRCCASSGGGPSSTASRDRSRASSSWHACTCGGVRVAPTPAHHHISPPHTNAQDGWRHL